MDLRFAARGDQQKFSDVDLAIDWPGLKYEQFAEIASRLKDLNIPYDAELLNLADVRNEELKKRVAAERKIFYKKKS